MKVIKEEDRRLVRHLAKKSKKKKVNVYFNKKGSSGQSKYVTGEFYSKKNELKFIYRSSYELAFFLKLEQDETVLQYIYEPFETRYVDSKGAQRSYRPDLMILHSCGKIVIAEVKPSLMVKDFDVQSKANSVRHEIKTTYKDVNMSFMFVTEKDIFKDNVEYVAFLKRIKAGEFK